MAHTLWTAAQAARSSLAALRYLTVLPRTVYTEVSTEFVKGRGQTISIRGPISVGKARTYGKTERTARTAITFDDITESWVDVKMEDQIYKAVRLPDDFMTFSIENLEKQVIAPMAMSVVDGLTAPLQVVMNAVTPPAITGAGSIPKFTLDGANALANIIAMRQKLNEKSVPVTDRYLAVGPSVEAALLNLPQLQKVNEAGGDGMLRDATLGRLFGFTIVADPGIVGAVGYHREAFAHVTRPSAPPQGATHTAAVAQDGFALRFIQHYNPLQLEDQAVLDAFVGAKMLDVNRAVRVESV